MSSGPAICFQVDGISRKVAFGVVGRHTAGCELKKRYFDKYLGNFGGCPKDSQNILGFASGQGKTEV